MSSGVTLYLRSHRETRGSSPGGQPARRGPESAGASSLRGDGGVGAQHTPGGPGVWAGISQDSQGLTGHREAGADQQGRVRPRPCPRPARPDYVTSSPRPLNPLLHQESLRPRGASRGLGPADGVGLQGPEAHVGEGRVEEDGFHGQPKRSQQHQGQRGIRGQHPAAH